MKVRRNGVNYFILNTLAIKWWKLPLHIQGVSVEPIWSMFCSKTFCAVVFETGFKFVNWNYDDRIQSKSRQPFSEPVIWNEWFNTTQPYCLQILLWHGICKYDKRTIQFHGKCKVRKNENIGLFLGTLINQGSVLGNANSYPGNIRFCFLWNVVRFPSRYLVKEGL